MTRCRPSASSSSTAWDCAGRARQRDLAGRHAGVRRPVGALPAHPARRPPARAVGLPDGQMGNSEVGHLNLGAGAVVKQDLTRSTTPPRDGSLPQNEVLVEAFTTAERVHLLGLVSDGGVHSGWEHLRGLIAMGAALGVPDVVVHAFTDGRDTLAHRRRRLPRGGGGLVRRGRQRPRRLGRRPLLRDGPRQALGPHAAGLRPARPGEAGTTPTPAWRRCSGAYERDETDEFIDRRRWSATRRASAPGDSRHLLQLPPRPHAPDRPRAGRARLRRGRPRRPRADRHATTHDLLRGGLALPGRVPARAAETTLANVLAERGMRQLHVAETEKYAARDLLLQRRRGGPVGARPRARPLAARRPDLRPQARDERAGRRRVRRAPGGRTATASGSSTSPTPTWSATPA